MQEIQTEETESLDSSPPRGIYLLPNLFTTAGLFAGFYAIVAAMKSHFGIAAVAIFIAMIADSLDGRVARLTNTVTAFGAEYDSLSDVIAFGLAPALFAYSWGLHHLGKFGWLAAFLYTAATTLRLARFNVQISGKRYFSGLPCPAAAGAITSTIWVQNSFHLLSSSHLANIIVALIVVFSALLMLSNLQYRSFKDSDFKNKVSFLKILIVLLCFIFIAIDPPSVLCGIFLLYSISGPFFYLILAIKHYRKKKREKAKENISII